MSKSLTNPGTLAGLLGSIVVLITIMIGILFPNPEAPGAPFYGLGTLLLLVNAVGLLLLRKGRYALPANLSLVVAVIGLAMVVVYAVTDILVDMGIGSTEVDWGVLMLALLLTFLGISAYAITAVVARTLPTWVGLSLAFAGVAVVLLAVVTSAGMFGLSSAIRDFVGVVAIAAMLIFFALWGIMSLTLTRDAPDGSPASRPLSPRSDVTA